MEVSHWLSRLERHRRRLAFTLGLLLLGAGGTAFGVASLAPDPRDLPIRIVQEAVTPLAVETQLEALELHRFNLFRSDLTRSNDTAESLLSRLGVADATAAAFIKSDPLARRALLGRAGRQISAEASQGQELTSLQARWITDNDGSFQRLVINRTASGFVSRIETAALTASSRLASGTIRSSLFAATDESRIPDSVAVQLAEIFAGDIDFHRSLRKGDRFSVVYEALEADGEPLRAGRVLSAEFVNNNKTYSAVWFPEGAQAGTASSGGYHTLDGQSLRRSFLASPLEFSRISSSFKVRFHPILQKWRAHLGVDYAAPTGTAVRSVGDGEVEFAGVQSGFGNVVFVKHRNNQSTVYAHLSRILVRNGQKISQGDQIGAVGSTGWATGPHLHFEFRVNGVHQDPLTVARQSETQELNPAARPAFVQLARTMRAQLAVAALVQQASAQ